ncbi:MAG: tetratricopeptide repeat protein [Pseudomonadota bacterium]
MDFQKTLQKLNALIRQGERDESIQFADQIKKALVNNVSSDMQWFDYALSLSEAYAVLGNMTQLENWLEELVDRAIPLGYSFSQYFQKVAGAFTKEKAPERAEPFLRHALILERSIDPLSIEILPLLDNLVLTYGSSGELEKAIAVIEQEIDSRRQSRKQGEDSLPKLLRWLSSILMGNGKHEAAILHAKECFELCRSLLPESTLDYHEAVLHLSIAYNAIGKKESAIQLLKKALTEVSKGLVADSSRLTTIKIALANLLSASENYNDAELLFIELIEFHRKDPSHKNTLCQLLLELTIIYDRQKKYYLNEPLFRELISLRRQTSETETADFARMLASHGRILMGMGHHIEAEPLLREALEIRKKVSGENSLEFASSLESLARIYLTVKKTQQAEESVRHALKVLKKAGDKNTIVHFSSLMTLARALRIQKRYDEAEDVLNEVLNITEKNGCPQGFPEADVAIYEELGKLYQEKGRLSESVDFSSQALHLFREKSTPNLPGYLGLLEAPIDALQQLGRHSEALALQREAIEVIERQGATDEKMSHRYVKLGISCVETGSIEEGEQYLEKAIGIAENEFGRNNYTYINAANYLVKVYMSTERWDEAEQIARASLDALLSQDKVDDVSVIDVMGMLAMIQNIRGKGEDAVDIYHDIVKRTYSSSKTLSDRFVSLLKQMINECLHVGQNKGALTLADRLQELQKDLLQPEDPEFKNIEILLERLKFELGHSALSGVEIIQEIGPEFKELDLLVKCINAFQQKDYDLVVRHAGNFDFKELKPALMVLLSLFHMGKNEAAKTIGDAMAKWLANHPFEQMLVACVQGMTSLDDVIAQASDNNDRCQAFYYAGERMIINGDVDRAIQAFEKAVEHAEKADQPVQEGILAQNQLYSLDHPTKGPLPMEIKQRVDKAVEDMDRALSDGRLDQAVAQARKAREIALELGPNHPTYAQCLLNLAQRYDDEEKYEQADELMERGIDILSKNFQANHPEIKAAVNLLIYSGAKIDIPERMVTRAAPAVRTMYSEFGLILLLRGLHIMIYSESYPSFQKKAVDATSSNKISNAILKAGLGHCSATDALSVCESDEQRCLVHYVVARYMLLTGQKNQACFHYDDAIAMEVDCLAHQLAIQKRPEEIQISDAISLIERLTKAESLAEAGKVSEAVALVNSIEQEWSHEIQEETPDSINILLKISNVYLMDGKLDQAQVNLEKADEICRKGHNPETQVCTLVSEYLGSIYLKKGNTFRGEKYLEEARLSLKSANLENTKRYIELLKKLVRLYVQKSNGAYAEKTATELVKVAKIMFGNDHLEYANAISTFGSALFFNNKPDQAIVNLEKGLKRQSEDLGAGHPVTLETLTGLIAGFRKLEQTQQGLDIITQHLNRIKNNCNSDDSLYAPALLKMSSLFSQLKSYTDSVDIAEQALRIFNDKDNSDKHGYLSALTLIADGLQAQDKLSEAFDFRQKEVVFTSSSFGEDSPEFGYSINALALTYDAMGDESEALSLYEKALFIIQGDDGVII